MFIKNKELNYTSSKYVRSIIVLIYKGCFTTLNSLDKGDRSKGDLNLDLGVFDLRCPASRNYCMKRNSNKTLMTFRDVTLLPSSADYSSERTVK